MVVILGRSSEVVIRSRRCKYLLTSAFSYQWLMPSFSFSASYLPLYRIVSYHRGNWIVELIHCVVSHLKNEVTHCTWEVASLSYHLPAPFSYLILGSAISFYTKKRLMEFVESSQWVWCMSKTGLDVTRGAREIKCPVRWGEGGWFPTYGWVARLFYKRIQRGRDATRCSVMQGQVCSLLRGDSKNGREWTTQVKLFVIIGNRCSSRPSLLSRPSGWTGTSSRRRWRQCAWHGGRCSCW